MNLNSVQVADLAWQDFEAMVTTTPLFHKRASGTWRNFWTFLRTSVTPFNLVNLNWFSQLTFGKGLIEACGDSFVVQVLDRGICITGVIHGQDLNTVDLRVVFSPKRITKLRQIFWRGLLFDMLAVALPSQPKHKIILGEVVMSMGRGLAILACLAAGDDYHASVLWDMASEENP